MGESLGNLLKVSKKSEISEHTQVSEGTSSYILSFSKVDGESRQSQQKNNDKTGICEHMQVWCHRATKTSEKPESVEVSLSPTFNGFTR